MVSSISNTAISGVYEIQITPHNDERGSFLNIFNLSDSNILSLWKNRKISQVNSSFTRKKGSIRGLHLQSNPYSDCKIVRCLNGKVWDVVVDLRNDSFTYGKYISIELSKDLSNAVFIPEGCAHGFQCLESSCELIYIHSSPWRKDFEDGIRWNDPSISIQWPLKCTSLSDRDSSLRFLN